MGSDSAEHIVFHSEIIKESSDENDVGSPKEEMHIGEAQRD